MIISTSTLSGLYQSPKVIRISSPLSTAPPGGRRLSPSAPHPPLTARTRFSHPGFHVSVSLELLLPIEVLSSPLPSGTASLTLWEFVVSTPLPITCKQTVWLRGFTVNLKHLLGPAWPLQIGSITSPGFFSASAVLLRIHPPFLQLIFHFFSNFTKPSN